MPSRFGPRHCGQLPSDWASAADATLNNNTVATNKSLNFILISFVLENLSMRGDTKNCPAL
jgi:hypothetical protein